MGKEMFFRTIFYEQIFEYCLYFIFCLSICFCFKIIYGMLIYIKKLLGA